MNDQSVQNWPSTRTIATALNGLTEVMYASCFAAQRPGTPVPEEFPLQPGASVLTTLGFDARMSN